MLKAIEDGDRIYYGDFIQHLDGTLEKVKKWLAGQSNPAFIGVEKENDFAIFIDKFDKQLNPDYKFFREV